MANDDESKRTFKGLSPREREALMKRLKIIKDRLREFEKRAKKKTKR
jgi:Trp operon repressor